MPTLRLPGRKPIFLISLSLAMVTPNLGAQDVEAVRANLKRRDYASAITLFNASMKNATSAKTRNELFDEMLDHATKLSGATRTRPEAIDLLNAVRESARDPQIWKRLEELYTKCEDTRPALALLQKIITTLNDKRSHAESLSKAEAKLLHEAKARIEEIAPWRREFRLLRNKTVLQWISFAKRMERKGEKQAFELALEMIQAIDPDHPYVDDVLGAAMSSVPGVMIWSPL